MAQPLQSFYDFFVRSFLGENGAVQAFDLTWMTDEMFSFGPVAFFLVLPALFYAMIKGPRRLKSVAIAFISYFYLVSLIFAWAPGTAELFEIFYVSAGFSMAFFFPPWRFTKKIKKIVQIAGCFLLFITLLTAPWATLSQKIKFSFKQYLECQCFLDHFFKGLVDKLFQFFRTKGEFRSFKG